MTAQESAAATAFFFDLIRMGRLSQTSVLCLLASVIIGSVGLLADQNSRIALNPEPFETQK